MRDKHMQQAVGNLTVGRLCRSKLKDKCMFNEFSIDTAIL